MKIEMGESLILSWLRHIKECQIVQTNWKPSAKWELCEVEQVDRLKTLSDERFRELYQNDLYKGNSSVLQIIAQAEIDVIGLNFDHGEIKVYAVDVAFHEAGLNYGSREETVARVIKKCLRTAMCVMRANHLFEFDVPFIDNFKNLMGEKAELADNKEVLNFLDEKGFKGVKISIDEEDEFKNIDYEYFKADTKINKFFSKKGDKATFAYDFGDGWQINILYEGLAPCQAIHGSDLPKIFEGEGFGIVEDCGGTGGLEDITKVFKKKSGKAYREYCEWLGTTELELFMFDIDEMNVRIKKIPRIFADIYEKHLEPTQQSINLIERKAKTKLSVKDKWEKLTPEFKELILNNAFCRNCGLTSIVNYTAKDDKHAIVLKGKCAKCGGEVVRLVEDV